jgi:hypothetical protein
MIFCLLRFGRLLAIAARRSRGLMATDSGLLALTLRVATQSKTPPDVLSSNSLLSFKRP